MINQTYIHGEITADELYALVKNDISVDQPAGSRFIDWAVPTNSTNEVNQLWASGGR
jgi:hypothetical protein